MIFIVDFLQKSHQILIILWIILQKNQEKTSDMNFENKPGAPPGRAPPPPRGNPNRNKEVGNLKYIEAIMKKKDNIKNLDSERTKNGVCKRFLHCKHFSYFI